jgi:plasmid rolling circle replication initiator protein Rep
MKLIKTADLRDVLDSYNREEISYSRMVELLNEIANKRLEAIDYSRCCKSEQLCDKCNIEKNLQKLVDQAQKLDLGYSD